MPQDPAGVFPSNEHRRVLAHLPTPDDNYGWTIPELLVRMAPDPDTDFTRPGDHGVTHHDPAPLAQLLGELEVAGDAEYRRDTPEARHAGWRMTRQGFERLTGPIDGEPAPVEVPVEEPPAPKRRLFRRSK